MSDKWEILEPTKWSRAVAKTGEIISTEAGRVMQRKVHGKIKAYHKTIDKHLETLQGNQDPVPMPQNP
eukprot:scaffold36349_cov53-Attheya_sp.AAC.4